MKIINPLTNKKELIQSVLRSLASQENCDGEPYDQMVLAANYIDELEANRVLKKSKWEEIDHPYEMNAYSITGDYIDSNIAKCSIWAEKSNTFVRFTIRRDGWGKFTKYGKIKPVIVNIESVSGKFSNETIFLNYINSIFTNHKIKRNGN